MSKVALYVVVFQVARASRRRRVDEALRFAGERIRTGVYEVACSDRTMARLVEEMERALMEGDVARVYPVCRRCQRGVKLHGGPALTEFPPAFIIGGEGGLADRRELRPGSGVLGGKVRDIVGLAGLTEDGEAI